MEAAVVYGPAWTETSPMDTLVMFLHDAKVLYFLIKEHEIFSLDSNTLITYPITLSCSAII